MIVVIAILAAITIVAYNGIQERARASAAQTAAAQAAKKVAIWQVDNPGQSPDQATFDSIVGTAGASANYQYTPGSSGNFCITATANSVSYFISEANTAAAGGCPGHGINGVPPVTNYAKKTSPVGGDTTGWTGYNAAGGHSGSAVAGTWNGNYSYRYTGGAAGFSVGMTIGLEYQGTTIAVPANTVINPSIHVRSNKAGNYRLYLSFLQGTTGVAHTAILGTVAVPANTWVRLTATGDVTVPAPADRMSIRAYYVGGTTWATSDWVEVSGVSTAPGAFADGDSPGWAWSGSVGNSISTGPQL